MRGRKPVPTDLKKLAGNPGHRPLNTHEPKPPRAEAFAAAPYELEGDPVALEEWRRVAPSPHLTDADRAALIALCQMWSRYRAAQFLASTQPLIVAGKVHPYMNPAITVSLKTLHACRVLWAELGLTPSSRVRLGTPGPSDERDPFSEFFEEEEAPAAH